MLHPARAPHRLGQTQQAPRRLDQRPCRRPAWGGGGGAVVILPLGKGNPEALAHFAAGESLESTGRHDEAMEEFYKSVMADPGNEKAAFEVAQWLLDQHHPERAVTLLSKVAHRPGASAPILSLLARADLQAGKTNAALAVSLQAIARQPDALQSYQSRLEVLVQTAKMAKALKTLDQAAKHIRNTPAQLIALANLYVQNSFTTLNNAASTSGTTANNANVYALESIVSATGGAYSGGTISGASGNHRPARVCNHGEHYQPNQLFNQ